MHFAFYFFTQTIYGIVILVAVFYGLTKAAKRLMPFLPRPEIPMLIVGALALAILPSLPRYEFARETSSMLAQHPEMKVLNATKWGDLIEPLTWFNAPVGSFWAAAPIPSLNLNGTKVFNDVLLRYQETPSGSQHLVNCGDNDVISRSRDEAGKLGEPGKSIKMPDHYRKAFCDTDWTEQMNYVVQKTADGIPK